LTTCSVVIDFLETWGGAGADEFTGLPANIFEVVGDGAFKIIGVARLQCFNLLADLHLQRTG
jgi:hypothetical protein